MIFEKWLIWRVFKNMTKDFYSKEQEKVIKWATELCSSTYHFMKWKEAVVNVTISGRLSDIPIQRVAFNKFSRTELNALENIETSEWVKIFNQYLSCLPQEYRDLIEKKYLQTNNHNPLDEIVYQEMGLSRVAYYKLKKEALYCFGFMLSQNPIFKGLHEYDLED